MKELDTSNSAETREIPMNVSVFGISPLKKRRLHYTGKARLGRKISSAKQCLKTKAGRSLNINSELLNDEALKFKNELSDKAKCFDKMIELLVVKVKTVESTKMKIQILTLVPY